MKSGVGKGYPNIIPTLTDYFDPLYVMMGTTGFWGRVNDRPIAFYLI